MSNIDINWIAGFMTEDPDIFCEGEYEVLMEVARPEMTASHVGGASKKSAAGKRMKAMPGMVGKYNLKRAKQFLDPDDKGREYSKGEMLKNGTPVWQVNNKHAEVPQKWEDLDDDEKKRHVSAEMGRMQQKSEMTIRYNKIDSVLKDKLGREPTVAEIDEIEQDPEAYKKISGEAEEGEEGGEIDKADQAAVVTKATEKIEAAPGLSAALRQITTADKLAELLTTILISPQLDHLDNKRELQGLIQAKAAYQQLMSKAA
jgi:hypothetical protein